MIITIEYKGKLTRFEVPEWALAGRLLLVSGIEAVAVKLPDENWKVKTVRCSNCGQCCMTHPVTPFEVDEEGRCSKLKSLQGKYWVCSMGARKPYSCLLDPPLDAVPECSIRHKEVEPE